MQVSFAMALPFLVSVSFGGLAILSWRRAKLRAVRRSMTALLALLAIWSLNSSLMHADATPGHTVWWNRSTLTLGTWMTLLYYQFVRSYLGRPGHDLWLRVGYILAAPIGLVVFFGNVVLRAELTNGDYRAELGPELAIPSIYGLVFSVLVGWTLVAQYRRTRDRSFRIRISYLLTGYSVLVLASFTNFNSSLARYPLDQAGNLVNALAIAYVVLRHDLLETTILIRRGALYALSTALVTALYIGAVLASVTVLRGNLTPHEIAFGAIVALLVGIAFQPLLARTQHWVDRVFFREEYEYRVLLSESSEAMTASLDLSELCSSLIDLIDRAMHVEKLGVMVLDEKQAVYRLVVGDVNYQYRSQLQRLHPVVQRLESRGVPLAKDDIPTLPEFYSLWHAEHEQMRNWDFEMLVPLVAKQMLVGILVLGRKRSEEPYAVEELSLLATVCNQAAVAIDKARLYEELRTSLHELKATQDKLVQAEKLRSLGEMAAGIAHDFNNLLVPMVGYPELIKAQLPEDHPGIPYCDAIQQAADQMAEINSNIMALGRRAHTDHHPTDLNGVVQQVADKLDDKPETLLVELDLAPDLLPVGGSEAQLVRVVANLVGNGRDAMDNRGCLRIKTENVYLDRSLHRYAKVEIGEYVRLTVADTGRGISPEIKDKVFDAFSTTKRADRRRGSGLGLTIVQAIVEDHRGYVDFETEAGKGTSFFVYIPVSRDAAEETLEMDVRGGSEAILVVDDDRLLRETVINMLRELGYRTAAAASGEEALTQVGEDAFDLLVLDMVMPDGIDGAETYRRALEVRPGQRAVMMSGFTETELVKAAQRLGAGAFLRKPMRLDKLARAVRLELDREGSDARGERTNR